jgi:hypothetical protein
VIKVYTNDKEYKDVFVTSQRISLTDKPEESDIILITDASTLHSVLRRNRVENTINQKPIFVTNYRFLKISTNILGAFYWKKGRSQLLFIKNRLSLNEYNITLPQEYKDFTVDEL